MLSQQTHEAAIRRWGVCLTTCHSIFPSPSLTGWTAFSLGVYQCRCFLPRGPGRPLISLGVRLAWHLDVPLMMVAGLDSGLQGTVLIPCAWLHTFRPVRVCQLPSQWPVHSRDSVPTNPFFCTVTLRFLQRRTIIKGTNEKSRYSCTWVAPPRRGGAKCMCNGFQRVVCYDNASSIPNKCHGVSRPHKTSVDFSGQKRHRVAFGG